MSAHWVVVAGGGHDGLPDEGVYDAATHTLESAREGELLVIEGRIVARWNEGMWVSTLLVDMDDEPDQFEALPGDEA